MPNRFALSGFRFNPWWALLSRHSVLSRLGGDALVALAAVLLLVPVQGFARAIAQQAEAGEALRIEVIEGEGSINNIRELTMRSPVVRVIDAAGSPVVGASVSFTTPAIGASAIFVDGGSQATVTTDDKGMARVEGMKPNNIVGNFEIRVTASANGNRATARIGQTNAAPAVATSSGGGGGKGMAILIGVVAAGVAVGLAFGLGGGDSSSSPGTPNPPPSNPVTITPGSPVFGAP